MNTTQKFKKQFPRNAVMAILSFVALALAAIWLTPYLVKNLGAAAYGLIPLAALLTQYVAIITTQLSMAVRRFLIIEAKKPGGNPNIVFNSALMLYIILIVVQVPLFALAILKINLIFSISSELLWDAQILFSCSAASFMVSLFFSIFGISIYSKNRLDISSTIELLRGVGRLVLILVFFSLFGTKLRYIGYTELILAFFAGFANLYYWRKLTPELIINFRHTDFKIMKPIFKMSFWTLVNSLGALLYVRTDIWIINRFISPVAAGQYAAILVIQTFIKQLGRQVSNQFGPTLRKLLQLSMKMTSLLIAIPIGIICVTAPRLLTTWLGEDFTHLSPIVWFTIAHLFINVGVFPLIYCLLPAMNKVKLPGLVTFFMGIVNLTCTYTLGVTLGMGVVGVALGGAIVLSLKNVAFTSVYGAKILGLRKTTFLKPLMGSLLIFIFILIMSKVPIAQWLGYTSGYSYLAITAAYILLVAFVFIWFVLITKQEKRILVGMLPVRVAVYARKFIG